MINRKHEKQKAFRSAAGRIAVGMAAAVLAAGILPSAVLAEDAKEWREENGYPYWYENGVKQGLEGRGKEIYDPASNAWYWLDAVDGGRKAVGKDVYQESAAGQWGDYIGEDGQLWGKWVRYDENGGMVKGWDTNKDGVYFFDEVYGTMAKGYAVIGTAEYYFNPDTGVRERELGEVPENGWKHMDGNDYWYEGYVRQGYSINADYRGKEIYDPASDAWYWLDNVDGGKKAADKDVYQESAAGQWGDYVGDDGERYGKWVRYDSNGHMVKGWNTNENGTYYFDPVYGTMAKGPAAIDGIQYEFDRDSGIMIEQKEMAGTPSLNIHRQDYTVWEDPVNSYLCAGKDGNFYRIEYIKQAVTMDGDEIKEDKNRLIVEEYNKDYLLVNQFELPMELSLWGGFYAGADANFLVFGERNAAQDNGAEVFRIVKYSKKWERQGAAGLYGANTTIPFNASSVRMAETDHILYVITGHQMYQSSDGRNHQANVHIAIDKDKMEITNSQTVVSNIGTGYVSHSFNQFIQVDDDRVLTVNHGDAYPRAIVLGRFSASADAGKFGGYKSLNVLPFQGSIGDNATNAAAGGFEISDTNYLIAGNMVPQDQNWRSYNTRNIFLAVVPKDDFPNGNVLLKQVTDYPEGGDYSASTPHLVEISKDRYAVLWEEKVKTEYGSRYNYSWSDDDDMFDDGSRNKIKIAYFDGEGNQLGEIQETYASLSDCHPVVINGKVMWYATGNSWLAGKPRFYELPVK